jgi:ATP adenylyltransferase
MSEPQKIWAPWRVAYLRGLDRPAGGGCFLCKAAAARDAKQREDSLVLRRTAHGVLMLNRFPYANGHLLVAPIDHAADLSDLPVEQRRELIDLAELGGRLVRKAMCCQGVNLGMNLGRCAGAGVPDHCHLHVVPRWPGDISFIDIVGQTHVIPEALEESYRLLKAAAEEE